MHTLGENLEFGVYKNHFMSEMEYGSADLTLSRLRCQGWRVSEKSNIPIALHETLIKQMQTLPEIDTIIECEGEDASELWILGENLNSKIEWEIVKIINAIERKFDTVFELRVIDSKFKEKIAIPTDGKKIFEK